MPNYPMHTLVHAQRSLQQLTLDRETNVLSEDAYLILRRKIEAQIRALRKREMLSGAAKIGKGEWVP